MTRDFEILFKDEEGLTTAVTTLDTIYLNDVKVFNEIEIREKSLFVTLTYPYKILNDNLVVINGNAINLSKEFVEVAKKNGEHSSEGFVFIKGALKSLFTKKVYKVWELRAFLVRFFKEKYRN